MNAKKDCFILIQQIALKQDPFCIVCGMPSDCGHHLFGRGLAAAFNLEMARGVCIRHHTAAHIEPLWFREYMIGKIGSRYEELEQEAGRAVPWMDFEAKRAELREWLMKIKGRGNATV